MEEKYQFFRIPTQLNLPLFTKIWLIESIIFW